MTFVIIFLIAYLIGSIPFGLILVRLAGKGDIRKIGSGNIGATNVLRTGSKKLAALTLLLDGGKGFVAVWLGYYLGNSCFCEIDSGESYGIYYASIASLGVIFGHMFPIWLKFRGGKGVATSLGALLALCWPIGLIACATWLIAAVTFRYSSLAAIIALFMTVIVTMISAYFGWFSLVNHYNYPMSDLPAPPDTVSLKTTAIWIVSGLVIARHHANIRRLLNGTEPKIGKSKPEIPNATP